MSGKNIVLSPETGRFSLHHFRISGCCLGPTSARLRAPEAGLGTRKLSGCLVLLATMHLVMANGAECLQVPLDVLAARHVVFDVMQL